MSSKGIPTHLITAIQKTCTGNIIRVNAGNGISEDSRVITQGVRQGHRQRMPKNYSPQGKRTTGRPKKRWREQL
jgi:hypothetical protein